MILALFGPPGAGKGTQAKLLGRDLRIPHVSTGDMFRDHKARGTELGKKVQAIMDAGGLVTDDVTNDMVKERLARPDVWEGFILDGYPRTTAQARFLDGLLATLGKKIDRVLSYEVAEEILVERMGGRRSCPRCGTVYHVIANPPRQVGRCDRDGEALVMRDDDRPETVRKRLAEYRAKTEPLKRYYQERGLLSEIDGADRPETVVLATKKALGLP